MIPRQPVLRPAAPPSTEPDPVYAPPPTIVEVTDLDVEFVFSGKASLTLMPEDSITEDDTKIVLDLVTGREELTIYKYNLLTISKRTRLMALPQEPYAPPTEAKP